MKGGWFELGRFRGAPVRLHWSALVAPIVLSGFRIDLAYVLGYVGIVAVHELGHAFVVQRRGLRVVEIAIHGLGGHCRHELGTDLDRQVIAWGGVVAQAWASVLLRAYLVASDHWNLPGSGDFELERGLRAVLALNERLVLFNMIPVKPLDGYHAWPLIKTLVLGRAAPLESAARATDLRNASEGSIVAGNDVVADLVANALGRAAKEARVERD